MISLTDRAKTLISTKVQIDPDGCWVWTGWKTRGYGRIRHGNASVAAHRMSYSLFVGEVPEGMVLDHLCRNRACCNPKHLEPVPPKVNTLRGRGPTAKNARKKKCSRGHLAWKRRSDGSRECAECRRV